MFSAALLTFFACDVDFDINERDSRSEFSAKVQTVKTTDGPLEKKTLYFELAVEDDDGVSSISVEIPAINVQFSVANSTVSDTMSILYTFDIDDNINIDIGTIYITLIDDNNNRYKKQYNFTID